MKKIKVIDLLNMIANEEEVPKKIMYDKKVYEWKQEIEKYYYDDCASFGGSLCLDGILKEEVEIIEDKPKEIEKIKWNEKSNFANCGNSSGDYYAMFMARTEQLKKGLNEIIDVLNELKNKENN